MKSSRDAIQPKYAIQYFVAFSAGLYSLAEYSAVAWNSPSIPKLLAADSPVPITPDEGSWLVSLIKIGAIIAPIPAAWMMDKCGRKSTLLMGAVPLSLGWILIGVAESVGVLYVARILCSLAYGIGLTVTPIYLGEIGSDKVRGSVSALMAVTSRAGYLYSYSIGPFVSVRTMAWLGLVPVILFLLTFSWQPETPYYYLGKQRRKEAYKSLAKLRSTPNVEEELNRMELAVLKSQENKGTFMNLFLTKGNRRGLIIIIGMGAVSQLCGSQSFQGYAETIFDKIGSNLTGAEATIILGAVQVCSSLVSTAFVDIFGRRPLLLFSLTGIVICNSAVAIYFNLERNTFDVSDLSWLPMVAIMTFEFMYTIGPLSMMYILLGELFPQNLKAVAGAALGMSIGVFGFVTLKLFQVVSDGLGSDYAFFGFAVISLAFIPLIWFWLPETKGKSLDLILWEINGGKRALENVKM